MANSPGERADAAYDRALRAFEERSYDVARSWALDALNEDPQHPRARALLARLDAARPSASPFEPPSFGTAVTGASHGGRPRKGPEPSSIDPNVLISRASGQDTPEAIEPTVIIQRDDPRLRLSGAGARAGTRAGARAPAPPPRHTAEVPVAEPTVIQPKPRPAASGARSSSVAGSAVPSLWQRLRPSGNRSPSPRRPSPTGRVGTTSDRRPGMWGPGLRGALIAIAAVAVASLVVWGAIGGWRWLSPAGEVLTIRKPVGGTITGPGLRCGTGGAKCSTTIPTGVRVELEAEPDADFVYSGFTGDCTPTGVSVMTQSRTCGATFDPVTTAPAAVTFTLTITKPTGGTVVGAGDILCGTLGSMCVAALPSGAPVTLRSQADAGYTFSQFTGDCAANGETTMTTARTCSATFTPTTSTLANNPGSEPRVAQPQRPQRGQEEIARVKQPQPQPPPPAPPAPLPPVGPQPPAPAPGGEQPPPPSPDGGKPAAAPITAEQHAKNEIDRVVKNYCTALETLKADRVKEWFPLQDLRALFKEYKSLKCTLTLPLEYERLDAAPAGVAQVKFEMKQVIQMRSGGAPKKLETIVWMTLSRLDLRSAWFIDRMRAEEKPPP